MNCTEFCSSVKVYSPFSGREKDLMNECAANFSFSLSLLHNHILYAAPNLICTSYDSFETCKTKYADAEENVTKVSRFIGAIQMKLNAI